MVNQIFNEQFNLMTSNLKKDKLPIVMWGNLSAELYQSNFNEKSIIVDAICDRNEELKHRQGGGIEYILPSEVESRYEDQKYNAIIVIPHPSRIKNEIANLPHKPKRIYYLDIAKFHNHHYLFKLPDENFLSVNAEKIKYVESVLEDEESIDVLHRVIDYWLTGDHKFIEKYADKMEDQYLDTISFADDELFVNLGVFDGHSCKMLISKSPNYKAIYNLECDPDNFKLMSKNLKGIRDCYNINKGAWNEHDFMYFNAEGNSNSFLVESGNIKVEVDSIDNLFANVSVTFIKADIEGAELKMLDGAKNIIQSLKPKLAICCYHQITDLLDIPIKIKSLNPNYKLKMRHYTDMLSETVCYAY